MSSIVPIPKTDVSVRAATMADLPFVDGLQKVHGKQLGFLKRVALEGKIELGQVLVAEDAARAPIGYVISTDRYNKHDDVGIVYQLNVSPGRQRGFVGATLLKAVFERAAYGCRLFSCWCAQDLAANRFWEAMGFVPLAYRAGSERTARVHIFWQKRIRAGDVTTPWWFPSETTGGMMAAGRLALPIPPGKHWSDELPIFLPVAPDEAAPKLEGPKDRKPRAKAEAKKPATSTNIADGGMKFETAKPAPGTAGAKAEQKPRETKPKRKNDPKLVAAARELRDRWLEQVNAGAYVFEDAGKYDVSRALPDPVATTLKALPHAA